MIGYRNYSALFILRNIKIFTFSLRLVGTEALMKLFGVELEAFIGLMNCELWVDEGD